MLHAASGWVQSKVQPLQHFRSGWGLCPRQAYLWRHLKWAAVQCSALRGCLSPHLLPVGWPAWPQAVWAGSGGLQGATAEF